MPAELENREAIALPVLQLLEVLNVGLHGITLIPDGARRKFPVHLEECGCPFLEVQPVPYSVEDVVAIILPPGDAPHHRIVAPSFLGVCWVHENDAGHLAPFWFVVIALEPFRLE